MSAIGGTQGISAASIQGMDLETAMLAVQSNRANLLETQLKDQIAAVQAKNDKISALNSLMGQLNAVSSRFNAGATASTSLKTQHDKTSKPDMRADSLKQALTSSLKAAGMDPLQMMPSGKNAAGVFDINLVTKGDLDGAVANLKGNIDNLSNTQQMDMLRLQSLSNKRNEAFDLMTNFIKKMQDSRNSIIGNMRG